MKTLYYSLRKVSQLTGLSPEVIKELQREAPEELSPVESAAGNPLYAPEQVELFKKKATRHIQRQQAGRAAQPREQPVEDKKAPQKSAVSPPPSFSSGPVKHVRHLHPLHQRNTGAPLPVRKYRQGSTQPPEKAPPSGTSSRRAGASAAGKQPASDKNDASAAQHRVSSTSGNDASFKFRAAISNLKNYKTDGPHASGAVNRTAAGKLAGRTSFTSDLREIRDILQELHDRL